jgi:predicted small lipoprotein YifL
MKNLTKIIAAILLPVFMITLFTACGAKEPITVDPDNVTTAVMDAIEFPSPVQKDAESIGVYYTTLDTNSVKRMSVYVCGSGAYPDEIAVFEFTDEGAAEAGYESVNKRYDDLVSTFTDYTPQEMYKLESPVMVIYDNYVVFIDCSDNEIAEEIVLTYFK